MTTPQDYRNVGESDFTIAVDHGLWLSHFTELWEQEQSHWRHACASLGLRCDEHLRFLSELPDPPPDMVRCAVLVSQEFVGGLEQREADRRNTLPSKTLWERIEAVGLAPHR